MNSLSVSGSTSLDERDGNYSISTLEKMLLAFSFVFCFIYFIFLRYCLGFDLMLYRPF